MTSPQPSAARRLLCAGLVCLSAGLIAGVTALPAQGRYNTQVQGTTPGTDSANPWGEELRDEVGVLERLNSTLPMDLTFTDEDGSTVTLGDYFVEGRPVIINLGYYRCPVVCGLTNMQLAKMLGQTDLIMGEDYIVLNMTIDPDETTEHALQAQHDAFKFLKDADVSPNAEGWRFLTADADTIKAITQATGYRYFYIRPQNEYGHPAVLVLANPSGSISRYMHGTNYDARTLRLSLVETSEGKVGTLLDQAFLTCFRYDSGANNYTATARFIMMTAGGVTLLMVAGGIGALFMYERRRRALLDNDDNNPQPPSAVSATTSLAH